MSRCEMLAEDLKAYVDGELPLIRRAAIGTHISHCAACREEIETMERMSNELQAGDVAALPADLRDRLIATAPEVAVADGEPEIPLWRRRPMQIWAGAATLLAAWFVFFPVFSRTKESARMFHEESKAKQIAHGGAASTENPESSPRMGGGGGFAVMANQYTQDYDESVTRVANASQPPAHTPRESAAPVFDSSQGVFRDGHASLSREQMKGGPLPGFGGQMAQRTRIAAADSKGYARGISKQEPPESGKSGVVAALQRDVKKTGELTVEVARLEAASDAVEEMVKESGGYVANNQLTTGEDGVKAASLDVRVPVNLFDAMMAKFSKLGEVKAKNVTGEDLTEQISDEKQAKRALGDELDESRQKLQSAKNRKDKREADQEVRDLKVQIAQTEGRLELLKKQARLSTISISLREKSKAQPKPVTGGFMDDLKDSGKEALASFAAAARIPFVFLVWVLAYSPVWAPLAFGYRYASRAHRKKVEVAQWQAKRAEETAKAV